MKPFRIEKDVDTGIIDIPGVDVNVDTTFVNKDVRKKFDEDNEHIGYIIGTQEWWWNEDYAAMIFEKGIKAQAAELDEAMRSDVELQSAATSMELLKNLNNMGKSINDTKSDMELQAATTSMELLIAVNRLEKRIEELEKGIKGDK